jgi:hypothetical protein
MDLFLPIGFDAVVNNGGSASAINAGFVETTLKKSFIDGLTLTTVLIPPPDGETYVIASKQPGVKPEEIFDPVIPQAKYAITLRKSPQVNFSFYFGKTIYSIAQNIFQFSSFGLAQTLRKNIPSYARLDGVLNFSVEDAAGKTLASAQAPFSKYAFKTSISLDLDLPVADNAPGFIRWSYASSEQNMFEACQFVPQSNSWPVIFAVANQQLAAKDFQQGFGVVFGPMAKSQSSATLTFCQSIDLRADSYCTANSYCNAEIDEELNIRAALLARAAATGRLLGPVDLSASAFCQGATSANATAAISLLSGSSQVVSARGFAQVGTALFLQANATATATSKPTQDLLVSERVSGMTLYVSLDSREFITSPTLISPITSMYFTRRDIEAIDVKFVRGGKVVELSYGATGQIGIKNAYSGTALALNTSWQQKGTGSSAAYQFSLNLNTEEINDLFPTDSEDSVVAKIEAEWSESGTINTTLPCSAIILNDVLRGTEGAPTLATASSFNISDGAGGVWTVTVDANGILTTQKV